MRDRSQFVACRRAFRASPPWLEADNHRFRKGCIRRGLYAERVTKSEVRLWAALSAALLAFGVTAAGADWPEFRGPWGDGHVSAPGDNKRAGLPLHWSETNNVKWKTEI